LCLARYRPIFLALSCAALCACSALLPRASTDTPAGFDSFEQAAAAAQRIVALQTHTSELKNIGFDPVAGHNVTLIPYPEIVGRLAPNPGVPLAKLDPGIRQCIEAQIACRGYQFHFDRQHRQREGNFWLDLLNFHRTTKVTGWWFDALIVISGDTVLFRNFAGQAYTDRIEQQNNPLGPLQSGAGAAAVAVH
jgi:hypothetical protein